MKLKKFLLIKPLENPLRAALLPKQKNNNKLIETLHFNYCSMSFISLITFFFLNIYNILDLGSLYKIFIIHDQKSFEIFSLDVLFSFCSFETLLLLFIIS